MTLLTELAPERIAEAWSDPDVRRTMSEAEIVILPDHPAGSPEAPESVIGLDPTARVTGGCRAPFSFLGCGQPYPGQYTGNTCA